LPTPRIAHRSQCRAGLSGGPGRLAQAQSAKWLRCRRDNRLAQAALLLRYTQHPARAAGRCRICYDEQRPLL